MNNRYKHIAWYGALTLDDQIISCQKLSKCRKSEIIFKAKNIKYSLKNIGKVLESILPTPISFLNEKPC